MEALNQGSQRGGINARKQNAQRHSQEYAAYKSDHLDEAKPAHRAVGPRARTEMEIDERCHNAREHQRRVEQGFRRCKTPDIKRSDRGIHLWK